MNEAMKQAWLEISEMLGGEPTREELDVFMRTWQRASQATRKALAEQPAQRTWVGLTDEAIWLEYQRFWPFHPAEEPTLAKDIAKFANAIEAKLKEKNT